MGRFVSATGQFLLATYGQFSCPPTGSFSCPLTYLLRGRPTTQDRHVFLTVRAPIRSVPADLLGDVVGRACLRAGLPEVGAHRLRHVLAAALLAHGVPLIDISAVLRHQDLATTALYAKVDFGSLQQVAQPWPGALR
jgi:site-specific recombinase XerD